VSYKEGELKKLDNFFLAFQSKLDKTHSRGKGELPYTFADKQKLPQMHMLSTVYNSEQGQKLRKSNSPNDVATFVVKLAHELLIEFTYSMRCLFGDKPKIGAKQNVRRIS
jgi:hypothetical protein